MPHLIAPTAGPKKQIVLVGGGPAGLEAARVAGARGHKVVLFEAGETYAFASRPPLGDLAEAAGGDGQIRANMPGKIVAKVATEA